MPKRQRKAIFGTQCTIGGDKDSCPLCSEQLVHIRDSGRKVCINRQCEGLEKTNG